jgi:hypothetical protein
MWLANCQAPDHSIRSLFVVRPQIGRTTARGRPPAHGVPSGDGGRTAQVALARAVPVQAKAAEPAMTHDIPDPLDDF